MDFDLLLRFEKLFRRSQGQLPVAYQVTAITAHNEVSPDFNGFFEDEWMNQQVEVGKCVVCYNYRCFSIITEL